MNKKLFIELRVWLKAMPGIRKTMEEKIAKLPPIFRFHLLGWDTFIFELGGDFAFANRVLILGGFQGKTTRRWLERGASSVTVFEPIPQFADVIKDSFRRNPKVTLIEAAAGQESGSISLSLDEDRTGLMSVGPGNTVDVPVIDFKEWLSADLRGFALTEINIEGAEYALLTNLHSNLVRKLGAILIQTHNIGSQTNAQLLKLTEHLSLTHTKVLDLPLVWTFWVPKETN